MKTSDKPIVLDYSYPSSVEKVWLALTRPEEMRKWFFENIEAFEPAKGFKTRFIVFSGERRFTHVWAITEVIPYRKISYQWKYEEYPGDSVVCFELAMKENVVNLKLTLTVTEDFPETIPEFTWESCIGGWKYFLGERLKAYLVQAV